MLEFIFIITIILEIVITAFIITKTVKLEKKIKDTEKTMIEGFLAFLEINNQIKKTVKKLNKIVAIFTSKKIIKIKNIIIFIITSFQIFYLIKSLNLKGGFKQILSFDNIKKILFANLTKELITKLLRKVCQ